MYRVDLIIGLPLSGIDEYSEHLRETSKESIIVFNRLHKNDGKVQIKDFSRLVIADPLCCRYRHALVSEIALTRTFHGIVVVKTYFQNDLDFVQSQPEWENLPPEMKENIFTLSREYFTPENAFKCSRTF